MTVQINYKNSVLKKTFSNLVLFTGENFNISALNNHISRDELSYISDLLKSSDLKKELLFDSINFSFIYLLSYKNRNYQSNASIGFNKNPAS